MNALLFMQWLNKLEPENYNFKKTRLIRWQQRSFGDDKITLEQLHIRNVKEISLPSAHLSISVIWGKTKNCYFLIDVYTSLCQQTNLNAKKHHNERDKYWWRWVCILGDTHAHINYWNTWRLNLLLFSICLFSRF